MADAKPLAKMNKTELLEVAGAEGVAIDAAATMAVIIAAIEAARAARTRTTQAEPTQPQPRDSAGRALDEWGLPYAGPVRAKRLAELGKPDPHENPEAWAEPEAENPSQPAEAGNTSAQG